jgi:hypothetical protein
MDSNKPEQTPSQTNNSPSAVQAGSYIPQGNTTTEASSPLNTNYTSVENPAAAVQPSQPTVNQTAWPNPTPQRIPPETNQQVAPPVGSGEYLAQLGQNTNPIFPKDTQIFLHPDHETLKAAAFQTPEKRINTRLMTIIALLIMLAGIASSFWFFFWPRSQTVHFAKVVHDSLDETSIKLQSLNKSLKNLYALAENDKSTQILTNVLGVTSTDEIAEKEKTLTDLFIESFEDALKNTSERGHVKGFSTSNSDPNKPIRDVQDAAVQVEKRSSEASGSQKKFSEIIQKELPLAANDIKDDLDKLDNNSIDYIDQASKTGKYYEFWAKATLELESISTTTNLDLANSQLLNLKSKFTNYKDLPDEMEKVNEDIIDLIDQLINLLKDLRMATSQKAYERILAGYTNSVASIEIRLDLDEKNFWKSNKSLGNYDDISKQQTDLLKNTKKLKNDNNFFLLDWIGVS